LLCVQGKTPDDGQRNCPKHVEFYSKNKCEKLVHLVGFIIRIYHDTRSPERHILKANSPIARRAHAVPIPCPFRAHAVPTPCPCRAAKGLHCIFPICFTQRDRV